MGEHEGPLFANGSRQAKPQPPPINCDQTAGFYPDGVEDSTTCQPCCQTQDWEVVGHRVLDDGLTVVLYVMCRHNPGRVAEVQYPPPAAHAAPCRS